MCSSRGFVDSQMPPTGHRSQLSLSVSHTVSLTDSLTLSLSGLKRTEGWGLCKQHRSIIDHSTEAAWPHPKIEIY